MTPTSVMTMLITQAKIGRSIKKCGKFIAIAVAPERRSFCGFALSDASLGVRPHWFGHRRDAHTGFQHLQTSGDNFLAVFKPAFHDSFAFEKRTGFQGTSRNRSSGRYVERLFQALLGADYFVGVKGGSL